MSLPEQLFDEVAAKLTEAGEVELVRRLEPYRTPDVLTTPEVAALLGVSSPNTIKNWMEDGKFPGAYRTAGGHLRFPRADVEAVKAQMERNARKNREGDLMPPEVDDDHPIPLL